uniref:CID domain-containing protein n=1 Tax=Strigamia maritima TaxID=126957 RepID=T1J2C0_STRMM
MCPYLSGAPAVGRRRNQNPSGRLIRIPNVSSLISVRIGMATFSENALEKKLADLNNSQQSIQTLSLWLIHHRKHCKTIVQVWHKDLVKAKPSRKLTFMYLANDVIQNSKRKGPEYTKEFGHHLGKAFENVVKSANGDEKTIAGLNRLLVIWQERGVYDSSLIDELRSSFSSTKSNSSSNKKSSFVNTINIKLCSFLNGVFVVVVSLGKQPSAKKLKVESPVIVAKEVTPPQASPREPPDPEDLIRALLELENSASSDAAVREKIASLPAEVSDISLLERIQDREAAERLSKQVDEACTLLDEYNSRLTAELDERKQVARMLTDFIQGQKAVLGQTEAKLGEFKSKLQKVNQVRGELKSHIQNLPDLTLLPDVTGGLAPLPSAGDLFNLGESQH